MRSYRDAQIKFGLFPYTFYNIQQMNVYILVSRNMFLGMHSCATSTIKVLVAPDYRALMSMMIADGKRTAYFTAIFFSILVLPAVLQNMIDVGYISRINPANLHAALNFVHERIVLYYSQLKFLLISICVQNELSLPEITFLNLLKDSLLAVANLF